MQSKMSMDKQAKEFIQRRFQMIKKNRESIKLPELTGNAPIVSIPHHNPIESDIQREGHRCERRA